MTDDPTYPEGHPYVCDCGGLLVDQDDGTQQCVACEQVWKRPTQRYGRTLINRYIADQVAADG